jgi:hypothetical protein
MNKSMAREWEHDSNFFRLFAAFCDPLIETAGRSGLKIVAAGLVDKALQPLHRKMVEKKEKN